MVNPSPSVVTVSVSAALAAPLIVSTVVVVVTSAVEMLVDRAATAEKAGVRLAPSMPARISVVVTNWSFAEACVREALVSVNPCTVSACSSSVSAPPSPLAS